MAENKVKQVCECGNVYVNFCVPCAQRYRQEIVEDLMDKYGMSVEDLIARLASHVNDDSFPALNLAITLKNMKPANKTHITNDIPPELKDVQTRLVDKLARFAEREGKG